VSTQYYRRGFRFFIILESITRDEATLIHTTVLFLPHFLYKLLFITGAEYLTRLERFLYCIWSPTELGWVGLNYVSAGVRLLDCLYNYTPLLASSGRFWAVSLEVGVALPAKAFLIFEVWGDEYERL